MIRLCAFSDEAGRALDAQIDALKRNQIALTELRAVDGTGVKDLTIEQAQQIQAKLSENGISVWSIGSPLGKVDISVDIESYLDEVRHVCALANIFKTERIRMFSFFNAYDARQQVLEYLRRMVAVAAEYGVSLYHENEKGVYGDTVERVLDLKENVPGLKLVYDPANFLQVGQKADKTLDTLYDLCGYFHIKDVVFETGELVPAGHGDGNIAHLIDRVEGDTVFTLEPHLMIFDTYNQIDGEQMKHRFHFENNDEAFDAAVSALKTMLVQAGYREQDGGFVKC